LAKATRQQTQKTLTTDWEQ